MSDPFGRLLFPLTSVKFSRVFQAGESLLDLDVAKKRGKYSCSVRKDNKPLKLSLERIEADEFTQALLQAYFFRQPDKEYGTHRKLLARLGMHQKSPLQMQYADQKYVLSLKVKHNNQPLGLTLFYSPTVGHIVARADRKVSS